MYTTLIDPQTVQTNLDNPAWVIIDCRFDIANKHKGFADYQTAHIPGAIYANLDDDMSSPKTPTTGRHPLPSAADLSAKLSAWGVDEQVQVVTYDADGGPFAARLWWLLRWLGHTQVAVLNGGLQAWQEAGYALSAEPVQPTPRQFDAKPDDTLWVDALTVQARLAQGGVVLDARAADRYAGQNETLDPVAGHVPGTRNAPFMDNVDTQAQQRFVAPETLQQRFKNLCGETPATEVIHMCGSGVTACHNLLAMESIGLHGAKLYVGSWSDWITDPNRPVAIGN